MENEKERSSIDVLKDLYDGKPYPYKLAEMADSGELLDIVHDAIERYEEKLKRMREALEDISKQRKSDEWEEEGDTEGGYDTLIDIARGVLKEVEDEL